MSLKICKKLIITAIISFLCTSNSYAEMKSVKGDKVNLRKGPGTKYGIKWEYGNGLPLRVLGRQGEWVKVKDYENDTGWIHKSLLEYNPQVIVKVNKNLKKKINIRKGPGTNYPAVGKAYYGVVFKTLDKKNGWIKVEHESGLVGWIKDNLVWGY